MLTAGEGVQIPAGEPNPSKYKRGELVNTASLRVRFSAEGLGSSLIGGFHGPRQPVNG
jgi:hypothetical protein